ncbi:MAG: hypothetical protein YPKNTGVA_002841, partial [Candidatus Fervidibacter sp.]
STGEGQRGDNFPNLRKFVELGFPLPNPFPVGKMLAARCPKESQFRSR